MKIFPQNLNRDHVYLLDRRGQGGQGQDKVAQDHDQVLLNLEQVKHHDDQD